MMQQWELRRKRELRRKQKRTAGAASSLGGAKALRKRSVVLLKLENKLRVDMNDVSIDYLYRSGWKSPFSIGKTLMEEKYIISFNLYLRLRLRHN